MAALGAAITNYHKLGGSFSHSSRGYKSEIEVPEGLGLSRGSEGESVPSLSHGFWSLPEILGVFVDLQIHPFSLCLVFTGISSLSVSLCLLLFL